MLATTEQLQQLCTDTSVESQHATLLAGLQKLMPTLSFQAVLSRGGWYHLGGIVDQDHHIISDNLRQWVEEESAGDIDQLISDYMDSGYLVTRLAGQTHYFTASYGEHPSEFVQLEIEELQAVIDRPLIPEDEYPDSLEEFVEPIDYERLPAENVGAPYYRFRRILPIDQLLQKDKHESQALRHLQRFFNDWQNSSASDTSFCQHWMLSLREYMDTDGNYRLQARPTALFAGELPQMPSDNLSGGDLAYAIHHYDRHIGYPFAWYFMMLTHKAENFTLAEAVLQDLMGAFDYLPAKDLKVLRQWAQKPYGV